MSPGVHQGSKLGSLVFNIFMNELLETLGRKILGYVDDLKI